MAHWGRSCSVQKTNLQLVLFTWIDPGMTCTFIFSVIFIVYALVVLITLVFFGQRRSCCVTAIERELFLSWSAVWQLLKQTFNPFARTAFSYYAYYVYILGILMRLNSNQNIPIIGMHLKPIGENKVCSVDAGIAFFWKGNWRSRVGRRTPALFSQLMAPFGICRKHVSYSIRLVYSYAGTGGCPLAGFTVPQVFQGSPSVPVRWLHHMAHSPGPDLLHSSTSHAPRLH